MAVVVMYSGSFGRNGRIKYIFTTKKTTFYYNEN